MRFFISIAAVFAVASAGSCPELNAVDPFVMAEFAGEWYNQYSRNTPIEMGSCLATNYIYDSDTEVMNITSTLKSIFGTTETMDGTAVLTNSSSTEGRLILTYTTPIGDLNFDLVVLSTDYKTYAVLYSCTKVLFYPYESSWILTKERTIDTATMKTITAAMKKVAEDGGPSFDGMKKNDQTNCS